MSSIASFWSHIAVTVPGAGLIFGASSNLDSAKLLVETELLPWDILIQRTLMLGSKIGFPPAISILILDPEDGQTITSEPRNHKGLEILKSIAYGGLTESVTSLGVVTSAASADATTLNILALALANLVGGLFIIAHNIRELRKEQQRESNTDPTNERYRELLGKRKNFILHTTVAILSFLVFGSVAPVVYGSSFRKSDNKEYKLAAVTAASLFCIIILAICKAYARKSLPKNYIKIVMYYAVVGFAVSGVSYLSGQLIRKLLENFALFKSEKPAAWAS